MSKHYDVVVLGSGIGALTAAVLLARRSWRVLVIGQGHRRWRYTYDGLPLGRRPFTFNAGLSPAWTRVVVELAQSQTFNRRARAVDPIAQVIGSRLRFDVPPDGERFGREIDREFPNVKRVVDDLATKLKQYNAVADAAFAQDVVWPPGGFWERRATERALAAVPENGSASELMSEFTLGHPYRRVIEVPASFFSDAAGPLSDLALARLHGAWLQGLVELPRGEDDVVEFLAERLRAHGGEILDHEHATRLVTRGSKVVAVELGDDPTATVGVHFVVGELDGAALTALATDFTTSRRVMDEIPRLTPKRRRFVVTLVVRTEGLPELLAREAFLLTTQDDISVRLQRHELGDQLTLLVTETLLPEGVHPRAWRERILRVIEEHLPFLERHYVLVDSPHDGRPLWDYRGGHRRDVERALLRAGGGAVDSEPMGAQYHVDPTSRRGLGGDGLRTPLSNAFVVGRTCMPALGQEGELLSAWSAARIITRTDRTKEKMRREMWSKIDLG